MTVWQDLFDPEQRPTGGDIYLNGEKQTEIVNSMPGGGGAPGGPQGNVALGPALDHLKIKISYREFY